MEATSARLLLPMMDAGQAQKERTHNEALALLDLAVQAVVKGIGVQIPPADPEPGDSWIVGDAPQGAWTGHAGMLAGWTDGGWRFVATRPGWRVWEAAQQVPATRTTAGWESGVTRAARIVIDGTQVVGGQRPAIADPVGGETVDAPARTAIVAILEALRTHGMIAR
ncbi:hypothetical protein COA17_08005 [Sphingomonas ginsenosidimutans]|jgi:hypothetical protein|uniref:DUF2793 domain-containing protein n=1 Tax=Sphingomonas ginsenosidimutans TaxID=862134 RepID=A0A2A4I1G5_9SPHN|nr:DUF2793 domain-containing protein [Sphingomonas ginsenosidimutans]PCG09775.1 hypothetical protein COA17_08005 [Sphingomonas ginsenosidimutans]